MGSPLLTPWIGAMNNINRTVKYILLAILIAGVGMLAKKTVMPKNIPAATPAPKHRQPEAGTKAPKLIFKKEMDMYAAKLSSDGKRFWVAATDGYLYCYSIDGKELWKFKYPNEINDFRDEQKFKNNKPESAINFISVSSDSSRIACVVGGKVNHYIMDDHPQPGDAYSEYRNCRVVYLDGDGKMLWDFKTRAGKAIISADGKRILSLPDYDWEQKQTKDNYYLLNENGRALWSLKPRVSVSCCDDENSHNPSYYNKEDPYGGFSEDYKYIFAVNTLVDINGERLWELENGKYFSAICNNYAIIQGADNSEAWIELYDLNNKKLLWKTGKKSIITGNGEIVIYPVQVNAQNLFTPIPHDNLSIYDLKSGKLQKIITLKTPNESILSVITAGYYCTADYVVKTLNMWNMNKQKPLWSLKVSPMGSKDNLEITKAGRMILYYSEKGLFIYSNPNTLGGTL